MEEDEKIFLHSISLDDLRRELKCSSIEELAAIAGLKHPNGVYKWNRPKAEGGTRPTYNSIIEMMKRGASTHTLFGIGPKPEVIENSRPISADSLIPLLKELVNRL